MFISTIVIRSYIKENVNIYKVFIDLFSQGIVKEELETNNETDKQLFDYLQGEADDLVKERLMKIDMRDFLYNGSGHKKIIDQQPKLFCSITSFINFYPNGSS